MSVESNIARIGDRTSYRQYKTIARAVNDSDWRFFQQVSHYLNNNLLNRLPLFQGMSLTEGYKLLGKATIIEALPGDRIINQGDRDRHLYIMLSGVAEVTRNKDSSTIVNLLRVGNTFMENNIFQSGFCQANLTALAQSEILVIPIALERDFLEQEYGIFSKLMVNWLQELSSLNKTKEQTIIPVLTKNENLISMVAA